jgi:Cu+-exporting ATPase
LAAGKKLEINQFLEMPGEGISGTINEIVYSVGSASLTNQIQTGGRTSPTQTHVHWSENGIHQGIFIITNIYREGIDEVCSTLSKKFNIHLLSGDNDAEKVYVKQFFGHDRNLHFNQSPSNKLNFIKNLQKQNRNVMMLGDGLNDAGALKQSDCGIAVSDNVNNFSPACDGILDASVFKCLPYFLNFSRSSMRIIYASYAISFLYNTVGISYAIQGNLSPLIAAVIMPLSTISIIVFTTLSTNISAFFHGLSKWQ